MIHQRRSQTNGRTDGRTDGETICDNKTALCTVLTVVHRAVKTHVVLFTALLILRFLGSNFAQMPPVRYHHSVNVYTVLSRLHGCIPSIGDALSEYRYIVPVYSTTKFDYRRDCAVNEH